MAKILRTLAWVCVAIAIFNAAFSLFGGGDGPVNFNFLFLGIALAFLVAARMVAAKDMRNETDPTDKGGRQ